MLNLDQAVYLNEAKPITKQEPKKVIKVEMFKAGPQLDSEGDYKVFNISDLDDVINTYNPSKHEAPLIVGHEQTDSTPSLGWVQKVWREGDSLMGSIELTPRAEKLLREGTFKKVSSSFYTPDAPTNPTPGKMSLRHLALVSIPAVKGLADFSEDLDSYINITNSVNLINALNTMPAQKTTTTKRTRRKSVANHAEGLNVTINIATDDKKKTPIYDDAGTQLDSTGNVADYTDDPMATEGDPLDSFADDPTADASADPLAAETDDPLAAEGDDPSAADPMAAEGDDPMAADPMADEGDDPLADDADPNTSDGEDPMASDADMDDISGDMETDDDQIAELAANYTHKQLFEALQLQKEAKASLGGGGSSEFNEWFERKKKDDDDDDEEDVDEEATKEYADSKDKEEEDDDDDSDADADADSDDITSLKKRVQLLEEELMRQKRMAREKEVSEFCETLYAKGKLTEKIVNRKDLSKFLVTLNSKNSVNFSEGGKQSQYRFMKSLLTRLPGVVSFSEVAKPESAPQKKVSTPEADGYSYDNKSMDTHNKALNYAESHGVDYVTALKHILA